MSGKLSLQIATPSITIYEKLKLIQLITRSTKSYIIKIVTLYLFHTFNRCWLLVKDGLIWAFVGPVIAIISVWYNCVSLKLHKLTNVKSNNNNFKLLTT